MPPRRKRNIGPKTLEGRKKLEELRVKQTQQSKVRPPTPQGAAFEGTQNFQRQELEGGGAVITTARGETFTLTPQESLFFQGKAGGLKTQNVRDARNAADINRLQQDIERGFAGDAQRAAAADAVLQAEANRRGIEEEEALPLVQAAQEEQLLGDNERPLTPSQAVGGVIGLETGQEGVSPVPLTTQALGKAEKSEIARANLAQGFANIEALKAVLPSFISSGLGDRPKVIDDAETELDAGLQELAEIVNRVAAGETTPQRARSEVQRNIKILRRLEGNIKFRGKEDPQYWVTEGAIYEELVANKLSELNNVIGELNIAIEQNRASRITQGFGRNI